MSLFYDKMYLFVGGLAQLARASALHAEGRGFESHVLHQNENKTRKRVFLFI